MSEIITQAVAKKEDDEGDRIVNLELLGDLCANAQIPFDPASHGLSADFQLTKFTDPLRKSLQLEREEKQSLLDLFDGKKEVISTRNVKQSKMNFPNFRITRTVITHLLIVTHGFAGCIIYLTIIQAVT